jgi:hypothetical protein
MDAWAIVELMGHRTRAGQVSEVELFGAKMMRIEVPGQAHPEYYSASAIYGIRVCTEDEARNHYSLARRPLLSASIEDEPGAPEPEIVDCRDDDDLDF